MSMKPMTYILAGAFAVTAVAAQAQVGGSGGVSAGGSVQAGPGGIPDAVGIGTKPTGVINDTGSAGGTSAGSTRSDANARMNTSGRGGTFSGRTGTTMGGSAGRLGVGAGMGADVSSSRY